LCFGERDTVINDFFLLNRREYKSWRSTVNYGRAGLILLKSDIFAPRRVLSIANKMFWEKKNDMIIILENAYASSFLQYY
jgi:hypothetical protein